MAKKKGKNDEEEEEEKRPEVVVNAYRDRLKVLRQAQEYSARGEIPKAVERYSTYLNTLAAYYKVKEYELSPKFFDAEKDLTELLLISNCYWDLAKAYDRSPKLGSESIRCLQQFVKFTKGFKYQHINAQQVKKILKRRQVHNTRAFSETYERLRVDSKSCFIATYAFGEESYEVRELRRFRNLLAQGPHGRRFISWYYKTSPHLVRGMENLPFNLMIKRLIVRPFLRFVIRKILR